MNKIAIIKLAMEQKAVGVDYFPKIGAACPVCGRKRCRPYKTMKPESKTQIRYHICPVCSARFRSVQELE